MSFLKKIRLRGADEFGAALKERRLAKGALFTLHAAIPGTHKPKEPLSSCDMGSKLGLIISKRNAPLAITRNTIKRVCREAFRANYTHLPNKHYVIRLYTQVPTCSLRQLRYIVRKDIDSLLLQAITNRPDTRNTHKSTHSSKAKRPSIPSGS